MLYRSISILLLLTPLQASEVELKDLTPADTGKIIKFERKNENLPVSFKQISRSDIRRLGRTFGPLVANVIETSRDKKELNISSVSAKNWEGWSSLRFNYTTVYHRNSDSFSNNGLTSVHLGIYKDGKATTKELKDALYDHFGIRITDFRSPVNQTEAEMGIIQTHRTVYFTRVPPGVRSISFGLGGEQLKVLEQDKIEPYLEILRTKGLHIRLE